MSEDLQKLIKTNSSDPDQARLELAQMKRTKDEHSNNQKMKEIRNMIDKL